MRIFLISLTMVQVRIERETTALTCHQHHFINLVREAASWRVDFTLASSI